MIIYGCGDGESIVLSSVNELYYEQVIHLCDSIKTCSSVIVLKG